jgi:Ca2+-binding EF-hand superfamily protein
MKLKLRTLIAATALGPVAFAYAQDDGGRRFGNGQVPEFVKVFDEDGNGRIDAEERQAFIDARKEAAQQKRDLLDANGDGAITRDEVNAAKEAAMAKIMERRLEKFDEADTDGSGDLSKDEFLAIPMIAKLNEVNPDRVMALFDRIAGEDGVISPEEFLRGLKRVDRPAGPALENRPHRGRPDGLPTGEDGEDGETGGEDETA